MTMKKAEPEFTDAEIERRMRETVRRSFELPHKMQKEMVGTVGRPRKRRSKTVEKPQQSS
jgi:hypothetical protein